ncbi:hypothetical protein ACLB2K_035393 [Fragaria x ananassa]
MAETIEEERNRKTQYRASLHPFYVTMEEFRNELHEYTKTRLMNHSPFWNFMKIFYHGGLKKKDCKKVDEDIKRMEGVMLSATAHITKPEGNFIINTYFKGDKVTKVMIDDALRAAIRDKKQQKPRDVYWLGDKTYVGGLNIKNQFYTPTFAGWSLPEMHKDMIEARKVDRKPNVVELQSLKDGEIHMEELETPSFGEWMNVNSEEMRNEGERVQERMRELIGSLEETTAQSNSTQEECNKAQELLQKLTAENEKLKEKNEAF